ncbi:MAG: lipopolysaccharide transport periplasmic protein LptA [Lysobacterales bacterium]
MRLPELTTWWLALWLTCSPGLVLALESDRQQPLTINADTTDGTLGDGLAVLSGTVEIHQGSLLVRADQAEVEKVDGRVRQVVLTGTPVLLQQEIEKEGLVTATALTISYQVATGIVTLTGSADVNHPQYQISGEVLVYDMNKQHFQGSGGDGNGRIRIELAPEVVPAIKPPAKQPPAGADSSAGPTPPADGTPSATAGDDDVEG